MDNKITLRIREEKNMSLPKYAEENDLDINALRRTIYKNDLTPIKNENKKIIYKKETLCRVKKSKEFAVRKVLVEDGYLHHDSLKFEEEINYKKKLKERKRIISRLRIAYDLSIKDFYNNNEKYFIKNNISLSYLYVFLSGIGTGLKKNTKAYIIKVKLEEYPLLNDPITKK